MILVILAHVLICAFLILTVLLQSGKAGDLASAFGGAGSQTAFGTRSAATLLTKLTTFAAVSFMVTCLVLSGWSQRSTSSVMGDAPVSDPTTQAPAPETATPATPAEGDDGVKTAEPVEDAVPAAGESGTQEQDPDSGS